VCEEEGSKTRVCVCEEEESKTRVCVKNKIITQSKSTLLHFSTENNTKRSANSLQISQG